MFIRTKNTIYILYYVIIKKKNFQYISNMNNYYNYMVKILVKKYFKYYFYLIQPPSLD